MKIRILLFLTLITAELLKAQVISHGPMLGSLTENTAKIWLRTNEPCTVKFEINSDAGKLIQEGTISTLGENDFTTIINIDDLEPSTKYTYKLTTEKEKFKSGFITFGEHNNNDSIRLIYGYGYIPSYKIGGDSSIFLEMKKRDGDLCFFLGDFPYTRAGEKDELRTNHQRIRADIGFAPLVSSVPTYGIWDDHDFGPNDCDGTHSNATEALETFKEYWANETYGNGKEGIYSSVVTGNVEFFLLDGRYFARQSKNNPTMLGKEQYEWLCNKLKTSKARYKVLVSGTPFTRVKGDCWGGQYYLEERTKLMDFISDNNITGVFGISGDVHRCDISRIPLKNGRYFYDFTAGALAQHQRFPPQEWPDFLLYSYGNNDKNMFGEINFLPDDENNNCIIFRSFSAKHGLLHQFVLTEKDLGL